MIFNQARCHPLLAEVALPLRVELLVVLLDAALGHGLVADWAEPDVPRAVRRVHAVVDNGDVALAAFLGRTNVKLRSNSSADAFLCTFLLPSSRTKNSNPP